MLRIVSKTKEDRTQKRQRTIDTFQARELHNYKEEPVRAFTRRGLIAGCSTEEIKRRRTRKYGI